jgi:hypothetical protein
VKNPERGVRLDRVCEREARAEGAAEEQHLTLDDIEVVKIQRRSEAGRGTNKHGVRQALLPF